MAHTPQVGQYEEQRQICDPSADVCADVIPGAINRLAVDAVVVIGPTTPGTTVGPTVADTAVGIGATVALPFIATATRQTIQNTTVASLLRVREVGGPAGSGHLLAYLGSITLGGEDGAMAAMEVENVGAVASSASVIFEGP